MVASDSIYGRWWVPGGMRRSFARGVIGKGTQEQEQTQIPCGNDKKESKCPRMGLAGSVILLALTGCNYHVAGGATRIPQSVRSIAVPIFASKVQAFHTETAYTEAVVRELNTRTRYRVITEGGNKESGADAELRGTIVSQTVAPLTYDASSGQTSSYLVSITASVQLVAHDGTVLYKNDAFAWHEQYQSTQDLSGFVQEDGAAVRRAAHDFAQSLVSEMLESFQ